MSIFPGVIGGIFPKMCKSVGIGVIRLLQKGRVWAIIFLDMTGLHGRWGAARAGQAERTKP